MRSAVFLCTNLHPDMEATDRVDPIVLNSREAARYIGISLRKLDELCAGGDLRPVRIGRKRLFPREQLHGLLKRAAVEQIG